MLPEDRRYVKVWRYWSVASGTPVRITTDSYNSKGERVIKERLITDKTCVDEELYYEGEKIMKDIRSFLKLLEENSVTEY
jgi:hypothetical protein